MTTPPGQDPQPGPTRGGSARPAPRGAAGWPADGRTRGPVRADSDPWGKPAAPGRRRFDQPGDDTVEAGSGSGSGGRDGRDDRGISDPARRGRTPSFSPAPAAAPRGTTRRYPAAGAESRGRGGRGSRGGGRGPGDGPTGPPGPQRPPAFRWLGALPILGAVYILLGATAIGVIGTLVAKSEPGSLLSYLVIIGSVVAALAIRRRSLYLLIPLPALLFFLAAVLTGAVKDRGIDTTKTELGLSFLQWIAGVFFSMCVATILVLVIGAGRWLLSRQLVAGQFSTSAGHRAAGSAAPPPRADPDLRPPRDWPPGGAAPWEDRDKPRGQRPGRAQDDADPWGQRPNTAGAGPRDPWGDGGQPPPSRDQRGQRDQRDGRDPRGTGNQQGNRDRPDPREPWGTRLGPAARGRSDIGPGAPAPRGLQLL
jgi:hypothetical protein